MVTVPPLARDAKPNTGPHYDGGDLAYVTLSGALVLFMIPGLAFLYAGLSRRKSALSMVWAVAGANAVGVFQWWFWGYSLAFSSTATNGFIGNLHNFALRNVGSNVTSNTILLPEMLYSFFQMEFACVTVSILVGAVVDRGRVFPAMLFVFCWMTLVYSVVACWVWSSGGWAFKWGVLDFAGGGPVEIGSGMGGLAYAWVLGRRHEKELLQFRPSNVQSVALGTFILWFGWLGFNGGSAFGANLRAITAIWNSMLMASCAGVVWCALDWRIERKYTMVGFCSGTIAGLVAATPASGFIPTWAAVVEGCIVGAAANFGTKLKFFLRVDDALDLLAEHAIGGMIGLLFNGFFATTNVIALDGVNTSIMGGFLDHNWKQLYIQFAYVCAVSAYVFVVTALLAFAIDRIPGCHLRASREAEELGMDDDQIGEFATDYVEVRRDYTDWTPAPGQEHRLEEADSTDSDQTAGDRHAVPDQKMEEKQHEQLTTADEGRRHMWAKGPAKPHGQTNGAVAAGDRHARPDHHV